LNLYLLVPPASAVAHSCGLTGWRVRESASTPPATSAATPAQERRSISTSRRVFAGHGIASLGALATVGLASLLAGCASAPPSAPAGTKPQPGPSATTGSESAPGNLAHFAPLPATLTPDAAARELVAQALLLVGAPYRWGGSRADSGFDCSGLIRHVFAESLQWRLPGSAREQFRIGQEIDRDALLPADLIFFSTAGSRASHVGLMIGPRRFVHAPNARGVVRIEEFRGNYWLSQFDGGRRLILRA